MSKRVLIVTGDAGESYETLYALHRFCEAGYQPVIAAPSKRALHLVIHDFEPGWDTYVERPGYSVTSDLTFDEVSVDDYVAVVILGGRAPEYLRHNPKVISLVKEFQSMGKWLFAICHGVQVLISAGLVKRNTSHRLRTRAVRGRSGGRRVLYEPGGPFRKDGDGPELGIASGVLPGDFRLPQREQRLTWEPF